MPAITANASFWVGLTMRVTYSNRATTNTHTVDRIAAPTMPVGLGVEHGRDGAEAEPLAQGVEDAEQRGPPRLDGDEDAEEERAEAGQPEPAGDRDGGVGVAGAEIDADRCRWPRPSPTRHRRPGRRAGPSSSAPTPPTVIERVALDDRLVSTNFSLSAGLPERSGVGAVVVCVMASSKVRSTWIDHADQGAHVPTSMAGGPRSFVVPGVALAGVRTRRPRPALPLTRL